jgi:hypothetical protein
MHRSLLALPLALLLGMAPALSSDAARAVGLDGLAEGLESVGAAEAAFIRRSKIKKKRTSAYRVVVVVGDDSTSNEVETVDMVIAHVPDQPAPTGGTTTCDDLGNCDTTVTLPLRVVKANGNKRFVFKDLDFSEDATNFSYSVTTTMKDAEGQPVGQPKTSTIEVEESGDIRLRSVIVRQLDETLFEMRAVVVGDFTDSVHEVWVCVTDYEGPDPEPDDCFTLTSPVVDGGKKVFSTEMSFSEPAAAADEVYQTTVDLRDSSLASLGATEQEIVVQGLPVDCPSCLGAVEAIDLLGALSTSITSDAAAALGLVVEPGTVSYEASDGGLVAWTAGTEDGTSLVVIDGGSILTIDEASLVLEHASTITVEKLIEADGAIISTTTARTAEGLPLGSWTHVTISHRAGVFGNGGMVGGTTPTGVVVAATAMYGDIIIGGMALDDFND